MVVRIKPSTSLVFYRLAEDTVIICRLLHGRRDSLRELFDHHK